MERTARWYVLRIELAIGIVALAWLVMNLLFPPVFVGGPPPEPGLTLGGAIHLAAIAVAAVGVAWMWRIMRADPEAGAPAWRYRDRD